MLGLGLGDILKPELILPLIETLPLEQRLAPYLPEVCTILVLNSLYFSLNVLKQLQDDFIMMLQGHRSLEDILELLQCPPFRQQVDSFTYVRTWSAILLLFITPGNSQFSDMTSSCCF